MCWWGVVPIERLHRQHGPLGTHPRMRMGHRTRHLWGQANGHLGNPLESQHRSVFCAPTIVPATFRQLVPAMFPRCSGHLFEHPLEQFSSNNLPLLFRHSSSLWTPNRWSTTPVITRSMFGWVETPLGCVASLGFHRPHKLGPYTMRPCGTLMPAFGWEKMWSGRQSQIMRSGHLSCQGHRPLKRPAALWTRWWSLRVAGWSCAFCTVAWH